MYKGVAGYNYSAIVMDPEEPRIVFDLGSHAIKAGYAGDDDPRVAIPSVVGISKFSNKLPVSTCRHN